MWKFAARRAAMLVAALLVSSFIVYAALELAPGDPLATLSGGRTLPPEAVAYQIPRVAAARQLPVERLQGLLEEATLHPLIGPPVVNVLALNQALENLSH